MKLDYIEERKAFLLDHYKGQKIVNVGSGGLYLENAIYVDMNKMKKLDIIGDFHHLPFKSNSFDVAFALDIIEHTRNPELLLDELERVSTNVIVECLDFDLCPANWTNDDTHVYYINKKSMKDLMAPRGYKLFEFLRLHTEGKHFRKSMLVGVKEQKKFDKQMYFFISMKLAFKRILNKL